MQTRIFNNSSMPFVYINQDIERKYKMGNREDYRDGTRYKDISHENKHIDNAFGSQWIDNTYDDSHDL